MGRSYHITNKLLTTDEEKMGGFHVHSNVLLQQGWLNDTGSPQTKTEMQ